MNEKKWSATQQKEQDAKVEAKQVDELKQRLYEERQNVARDRNLKIKAWADANDVLITQRAKLRENQAYEKTLERNSYFPFTHGDLVE